MNISTRTIMAFFLLFGLAFAATVGIGDTILVSGSDLGDEGTPPVPEPGPAGNGTSNTGATPAHSGSVVVSIGETTDSAGNVGQGSPPSANGTGSSQSPTPNATPANPQPEPVMNRERFMLTTASGEAVQAGMEISAVQVSPGRIEVMQEGNAFAQVLANGEAQQPTEIDAEVSSFEGDLLRLRIQAREQQMLMSMGNTSVSTAETLRIRERIMYLEKNGVEYRLNVLPSDLPDSDSPDASLENITLEFSQGQPAYRFTMVERRNFLGIFPVDSETRFMLNAQNAQILSEEGPWWGFMAPAANDLRPALNQLAIGLGATGEN